MNYCSCSRLCEGPLMMCLRAAMVTFKQKWLHRLSLLFEICSFPLLMKSCFYGLPVNRILEWVYSKLLKQSCCFSSVSTLKKQNIGEVSLLVSPQFKLWQV